MPSRRYSSPQRCCAAGGGGVRGRCGGGAASACSLGGQCGRTFEQRAHRRRGAQSAALHVSRSIASVLFALLTCAAHGMHARLDRAPRVPAPAPPMAACRVDCAPIAVVAIIQWRGVVATGVLPLQATFFSDGTRYRLTHNTASGGLSECPLHSFAPKGELFN